MMMKNKKHVRHEKSNVDTLSTISLGFSFRNGNSRSFFPYDICLQEVNPRKSHTSEADGSGYG